MTEFAVNFLKLKLNWNALNYYLILVVIKALAGVGAVNTGWYVGVFVTSVFSLSPPPFSNDFIKITVCKVVKFQLF